MLRRLPGELRRSHFAPLAGERFEFEQDVFAKVGARLASRRAARARPRRRALLPPRSSRPRRGSSLAQGSWRVTHPALGTQVMFVSPNDAEGRVAEAIFNRA